MLTTENRPSGIYQNLTTTYETPNMEKCWGGKYIYKETKYRTKKYANARIKTWGVTKKTNLYKQRHNPKYNDPNAERTGKSRADLRFTHG